MRAHGFTLLELLVALAIFAFLGVMAYGGLAAMLRMGEGTAAARKELASLQRNVRLMEEDMAFVLARPVRDGLGSPHLAFMSGRDGATLLEFSRATRPLEGVFPSPIERVRYVLVEGALQRQSWNPPDAAHLEPDQTQPLWPVVETVSLRFIDRQQQSFTSWPPPNVEQPGLPRAVEWTVQPKGQTAIRLLLPLPELPPPEGGKS
jgi:general secretion pathway protein J